MLNVAVSRSGTDHRRATSIHQDRAVIATPFAAVRVGVTLADGRISSIDFLPADAALSGPATRAGRIAVEQLQNYFRDPASRFTAPLAVTGTAFQQRVWRALRAIPAGSVCTYGELARRLTTSARAIGNACRRNPLPIIVPCHRVVATAGRGGFCGATRGPMLTLKEQLLAHENAG